MKIGKRSAMMMFLVGSMTICGSKLTAQQDPSKNADNVLGKPLNTIHAIAVSANGNFGVSKANFNKGTSAWAHPFGYSITGGAGVSFLMKNNFGIEADFSYEFNTYLYKNKGVALNLGYRAPYVDVKLKKNFTPKAEHNTIYFKAGVGYMFGGSGGLTETANFYTYSINFVSSRVLLFTPEVGLQKRLNRGSYLDMGIIYRYGLGDIISSSMTYLDTGNPLNNETASSSTRGNYIGVSLKYFFIFKELSKKNERAAPDSRF